MDQIVQICKKGEQKEGIYGRVWLVRVCWIKFTYFMSKISVRPDSTPLVGLKPTAFPTIDLSRFAMSSTQSMKLSKVQQFPDQSTLQFTVKKFNMPNVFQYNQRSKLMMSSDEQAQEQSDHFMDKTIKNEVIKKSNEDRWSEQRRKQIRQEQWRRQEQEKRKKSLMRQEEMKKKEKLKVKCFEIKKISQMDMQVIIDHPLPQTNTRNISIKLPNLKQQSSLSYSLQQDKSMVHSSLVPQKQSKARLQSPQPSLQIQQTPRNISFHQQQQQSRVQNVPVVPPLPLATQRKSVNKNINSSNAKVQTQRQNQTERDVTPSKRKRKPIFGPNSIKRQSKQSSYNRALTPTRGVQTDQRPSKNLSKLSNQRRCYHITPQSKALNILDKLVDQIGTAQPTHSQITPYCHQQTYHSQTYSWLSSYIERLSSIFLRLQNLQTIQQVLQNQYQLMIDRQYAQILRWKEKIRVLMLDLPFNNAMEYQIIKKFQRISQNIENYASVSVSYQLTDQRLAKIQQKLEAYVLIVKRKDAKALYQLMTDVNREIDKLGQQIGGCGSSKVEKIFAQYLKRQLQQLLQIKKDIDANFENDFPQLKF